MSFVDEEAVFAAVEHLMQAVFRVVDREVAVPFPRLTYDEAMTRYGSDKPICASRCRFRTYPRFPRRPVQVFRQLVAGGGSVRALVPGAGRQSRAQIDNLVDEALGLGAKGLVWVRQSPEGAIQSSILKAAGEEALAQVVETSGRPATT